MPPVPVHAVDTVGAGDAFVAGYLASRLAGRDVRERLSTAAAERALVGGGVRRRDRRQVVDQVAASVFLQTWLDRRAGEASGR